MPTNGQAVMENVRRYRAIASLYRQTAAFRPRQSCSLLGEAMEWERRAVAEIEAYFNLYNEATDSLPPQAVYYAPTRWEALAAA